MSSPPVSRKRKKLGFIWQLRLSFEPCREDFAHLKELEVASLMIQIQPNRIKQARNDARPHPNRTFDHRISKRNELLVAPRPQDARCRLEQVVMPGVDKTVESSPR